MGDQVAAILQYDLEYQNLLMCSMRGQRSGCWSGILRTEDTVGCEDVQDGKESWISQLEDID